MFTVLPEPFFGHNLVCATFAETAPLIVNFGGKGDLGTIYIWEDEQNKWLKLATSSGEKSSRAIVVQKKIFCFGASIGSANDYVTQIRTDLNDQ